MTRLIAIVALGAALLVAPLAPALAQMAPAATGHAGAQPIPAADREAALDAIAAAIPKTYVFPDKVPAILAAFARARQAGRYDLADPEILAERVTEDLRAASGDRHLYLNYDPARYAAATVSAAPAAEPAGENADAYEARMAARDHQGLTELKILPGNIRYLKIVEFQWIPDVTGGAYDDAMRFLKDGDAVIIDVRGNPGGSHGAVRYLVSHFMDGDVLELTFLARGHPDEQSRTLEYLPVGRMKGKPLYVLIDGGVGSAAEAFAYDVEQFKLGELVGAKTAGAANNNDFTPIAPGFMLSVPFGRPEHAVSHANWEAVGVAPTVAVDPARALETAQSLALARLAAAPGLTAEQRADYDWAKVAVEAQIHPVILSAARLKALAGRYEGYVATVKDGALFLTQPSGRVRKLTPLNAEGLFAVEGSSMLRARFTATTLETLWKGDTSPRVMKRDQHQ